MTCPVSSSSKWNMPSPSSIFYILNALPSHVSACHGEAEYEMYYFYYYSCSSCHRTPEQLPQSNDTDILILSYFELVTLQKETAEYFLGRLSAAITFMFHVCVGGMICYRNWWPAWYFKRLRCILLSDCFLQIYICLKGGCGCQQ